MPRAVTRTVLAAMAGLAAALASPCAEADEPEPDPEAMPEEKLAPVPEAPPEKKPERPRLKLALLAPEGDLASVEPLVVAAGSGLIDLGIDLFVLQSPPEAFTDPDGAAARELASGHGAFAAVWVDRARGGMVFAVSADGAVEGVIQRSTGELDPDAQTEAMAVIIRTACEQVLEAQAAKRAEATTTAAAPPTPPSAPPPASNTAPAFAQSKAQEAPKPLTALDLAKRDAVGLTQETEYAMHFASPELGDIHGVNLRIGASIRGRFAVYAGYTVFSTTTVRMELAELKLSRHPVHLGAKARFGEGRLRGFVEANLLLDYLVPELVAADAGLFATDTETSVQSSALLAAGVGVRIFAVATLYAAAGAEIPFNRSRYVVGSGEKETVVADPWPVQPWVLAGLILDVL